MMVLRSALITLALLQCMLVVAEDGPKPEEMHTTVAAILSEFGSSVEAKDLQECLPKGESMALQTRINKAIEKMLQLRASKMRESLSMLGRASRLLAAAAESKCSSVVAQAADLKTLAGQVEEFGKDKKHISYKAKEKLLVGGYDLHKPLNKLIGDWKKADAKQSGTSFGEFFKVFKGGKAKSEL